MTLCSVEYVWLDGNSPPNLRSKVRILPLSKVDSGVAEVPDWWFDGSSTAQAEPRNSDLLLHPVHLLKHFKSQEFGFVARHQVCDYVVFCEVLLQSGAPHATNTRAPLVSSCRPKDWLKPLFGFEQEYVLMNGDDIAGWREDQPPQGLNYCGVGVALVSARQIESTHRNACLAMGLHLNGTNAEVLFSQWEYQLGPLHPVRLADEVWISRWLLHHVAELYHLGVSFHPKPKPGNWNGSGGHINLSTYPMRETDGIHAIRDFCDRLSASHTEVLRFYGKDNELRLVGTHETSSMEKYSCGIADRTASVRIPRHVQLSASGYLEDRRPAANCDPYAAFKELISLLPTE